jgi:hypothetical protein
MYSNLIFFANFSGIDIKKVEPKPFVSIPYLVLKSLLDLDVFGISGGGFALCSFVLYMAYIL